MNITVVHNPAARGAAPSATVTSAIARLRADGHTITTVSGGSAAETTRLVAAAVADGTDAVVAAGGDGTMHLALQVLAGTDVPLGLLPVGTGNDMAETLGIPELDPDAAAALITAGHTRRIDLGRVHRTDGTSVVFGTVLASGFDSAVNERANRMRFPRGRLRYKVALLLEFLVLRGADYTLDIDGERVTGHFVVAAIGNGGRYGGGVPICPYADLGDGMLDVTVVRHTGRLRLLRLLPTVYRGTHTALPDVLTFRARRVGIAAAGLTAWADGDPLGALPVAVECVPAAVRVFAPVSGSAGSPAAD
ncbi:diacylglycerol kinase [Microbacterium fluvii]|uniref:Diacylglycerol kinase n=1 Tax=Microbacterium fluvii TaxID=415215 RepID=A0ABW2HEG6_9MICO|nr:diacylglycerol kinase [Microbacterium fluvii]MCU4671485.1 diacylglycerol kinase [Microbacterium fluvii]